MNNNDVCMDPVQCHCKFEQRKFYKCSGPLLTKSHKVYLVKIFFTSFNLHS